MGLASGHSSAISGLQSGPWGWDLHRSLLFYKARQFSGGWEEEAWCGTGAGCLLKDDGSRQPVTPANQEALQEDSLVLQTLQTNFKATWATWQDPVSQ